MRLLVLNEAAYILPESGLEPVTPLLTSRGLPAPACDKRLLKRLDSRPPERLGSLTTTRDDGSRWIEPPVYVRPAWQGEGRDDVRPVQLWWESRLRALAPAKGGRAHRGHRGRLRCHGGGADEWPCGSRL